MLKNDCPASVSQKMKDEYRRNLNLLTGGSGRLLLVAGDQKVEHLNDDFFGRGISPEDAEPEHLFKVAAASNGGVLATHLGFISRYGQDYPNLPYIVKINGRSNLGSFEEKLAGDTWWNIEQIINFKKQSGLKIAGIGLTIYLGNKYETAMLSQAAQLIFEAHQAGLVAIVWMYPRGPKINEEAIHTIAGGAGVAAALDADFVKVKYPYGSKNKKIAEAYREVIKAAGRTKVICVGSSRRPAEEIFNDLEKQLRVGANGLAIGRNLHQRDLKEASLLGQALKAMIIDKASVKEAKNIYSGGQTAKNNNRKTIFGLF